MIHEIGQLIIDVNEIACIGNRENVNGHACGVDVWLRGGAKVFILIEGIGTTERNNYDGPVPQKLMHRADEEINNLKQLWKKLNESK